MASGRDARLIDVLWYEAARGAAPLARQNRWPLSVVGHRLSAIGYSAKPRPIFSDDTVYALTLFSAGSRRFQRLREMGVGSIHE
jgi:hypothetical protein